MATQAASAEWHDFKDFSREFRSRHIKRVINQRFDALDEAHMCGIRAWRSKQLRSSSANECRKAGIAIERKA